ncbi:unnamed protein product [Rangifer tarandus platyrhynchus]|uniref:Uncharacterized protein n=1 Tax=Rangifer tarandus platyrhynchus TaxID=3082113 RepID=A0ABN8Y275_RANTA|nr:unnamed protein product [Rangifer tarandus platyrhynchus]
MPAGGSEDRGPRSAEGPNQTPPGPRVPEPRTGVGRGGADRWRAWRGQGREGDETSAPLTPTPSPGMHTRPAARGLETLRTPVPGQVCWPGLPVCGDRAVSAGLWPARPVERWGRLARHGTSGRKRGRIGAQGPGCTPPMPAGGSEDRGPRSAEGPNQTPPGPRVPEPRTGVGRGGADRWRAWRGQGREGDETSAPLTPTPSPGMHTRPAARGLETLRTPVPGQVCWPGLPVCGDRAVSAGLWPARPVERWGRLARHGTSGRKRGAAQGF